MLGAAGRGHKQSEHSCKQTHTHQHTQTKNKYTNTEGKSSKRVFGWWSHLRRKFSTEARKCSTEFSLQDRRMRVCLCVLVCKCWCVSAGCLLGKDPTESVWRTSRQKQRLKSRRKLLPVKQLKQKTAKEPEDHQTTHTHTHAQPEPHNTPVNTQSLRGKEESLQIFMSVVAA